MLCASGRPGAICTAASRRVTAPCGLRREHNGAQVEIGFEIRRVLLQAMLHHLLLQFTTPVPRALRLHLQPEVSHFVSGLVARPLTRRGGACGLRGLDAELS